MLPFYFPRKGAKFERGRETSTMPLDPVPRMVFLSINRDRRSWESSVWPRFVEFYELCQSFIGNAGMRGARVVSMIFPILFPGR